MGLSLSRARDGDGDGDGVLARVLSGVDAEVARQVYEPLERHFSYKRRLLLSTDSICYKVATDFKDFKFLLQRYGVAVFGGEQRFTISVRHGRFILVEEFDWYSISAMNQLSCRRLQRFFNRHGIGRPHFKWQEEPLE